MGKASLFYLFFLVVILGAAMVNAKAKPDFDDEDFFGKNSSEEEEDEPAPAISGKSIEDPHKSHNADGHKGHIMSSTNSTSAVEKSGFSGSNYAGFNESCSSGRICNPDRGYECTNQKCVCKQGYTYVTSQESCHEIWSKDWAASSKFCDFQEQCRASVFGHMSRCNHLKSCECFDHITGGKSNMTQYKGTCYIAKNPGDVCENHIDCQASMKENAVCVESGTSTMKVCQCKGADSVNAKYGYVWDNLDQACLKIADQGPESTCSRDSQCKLSPMGNLTKCDESSRKCACFDATRPNDEMVFYPKNGECYDLKVWNDTCLMDEECQASLSSEAKCLLKDESEMGIFQKTCQCPKGKKCVDDRGTGAVVVGSGVTMIFGFVILAFYQQFFKCA